MQTEDYDAIILAAAGLSRMGWSEDIVTEYLDADICLPAVGQGALAIECREDDTELLALLKKLECKAARQAVTAERAFMNRLEGGCQVPLAGFARLNEDGEIVLTGLVATADGKTLLKEEQTGTDPEKLGVSVAEKLLERGAGEIIRQAKEGNDH